jgi:uncharacterized protein
MSSETVNATARRIAEHADAMDLADVYVVLHGGEPLLMGVDRLRETVSTLSSVIGRDRLHLQMQTNGILLSPAICDVLVEFDVAVGVSLDGDRAANDRHRRYASGASSYEKVRQALALLRRPEYRSIYSGILCTVDLENDPIAVYSALRSESPRRIDFLLPHATWDTPPTRPGGSYTAYADWLLAIYDRWVDDGRSMGIRLFDSLISTAHGGSSLSEWVGPDPVDLVVVETDGMFEQADTLKTTYDGAPATGMSVLTHSVADVAALPEIARRQAGVESLAPECVSCPVVRQCGGGLFAHRFKTGNGFDNPSVYCSDLKELIVSMNAREARIGTRTPDQPDPFADELIDRLASGRDDADAVEYLVQTQLGYARALLATVADRGALDPLTQSAWELLAHLDEVAPDSVDAVLAHPYIRPWAINLLRTGNMAETGYLAAVASAAAVDAGVDWTLRVPTRHGRLHLPSVGSMPTGDAPIVEVSTSVSGFEVRSGGDVVVIKGEDNRWQPTRHVVIGSRRLILEDHDPYRSCHAWFLGRPLDDDEAAAWRDGIAAAWDIVGAEVPHRTAGILIGLRAVAPLELDATGRLRSSTARDAFGAFAVAAAPPESLAVMLVHEFQHSVLGAILDNYALFDRAYRTSLRVAWRTDPRPIEGALQGTYAHFAVAEMWRARAERTGDAAARTKAEQYLGWTIEAADTLLTSSALTPLGSRLVSSLAASMASWSR